MKMDQNTQKTAREKISRKGGGSKYFKVGGDTKVGGDRAIRGGYISFPHYVVVNFESYSYQILLTKTSVRQPREPYLYNPSSPCKSRAMTFDGPPGSSKPSTIFKSNFIER